MQVVHLFLKIFHLLLDGRLTVYLLIILLLGGLCLSLHLGKLQIFIYHLFKHIKALLEAVLGQHRIPLLVGIDHPERHHRPDLRDPGPSGRIAPDHRSHLIIIGKAHDLTL